MGGDRRRTSHSIEVPSSPMPQHNSRKRPPSYTHDCNGDQCYEDIKVCDAAMILLNLSHSPKSPKNGDKWLGSSPGSSSASWSSGSSSPPLSDDGHAHTNAMLNNATASARMRTTSVSTSDEGIVVDFKEEAPRKKRAYRNGYKCTWKGCNFSEHTTLKMRRHIRTVHLGKKVHRSGDFDGSYSESDNEEEFYFITDDEFEEDDDEAKVPSPTSPPTLSHRDMARPPHEDPEYQRQIVGNFKQGRAANLSHHHGGKSIHSGNMQIIQLPGNHVSGIPTSPLAHHNYNWPSSNGGEGATAGAAGAAVAATEATVTAIAAPNATSTPAHTVHNQSQQQQQQSPALLIKHARSSPRPSQSTAPYPSPTYVHHHHHNYSSTSTTSNASANSTGHHSNSSSTNSPLIHGNSSANNMLQQLTQQNVTVTAHHNGGNNNHNPQQQNNQHHQPQLSAVTITPNYHHHSQQQTQQQQQQQQQQQHLRGNQHSTAATGTTASTANLSGGQPQPQNQHQRVSVHSVAGGKHTPNSPHRRTRGENKKCRKVYGMERRDQWCTQCKWKKACSRFGD